MGLRTLNTGNYPSTLSKEERLIVPLRRITATIGDGSQIIAQHTLETCIRVTSRGAKRKYAGVDATWMGGIPCPGTPSPDQFQGMFRYYLAPLLLLISTVHSL
jgi:hypothetical protein